MKIRLTHEFTEEQRRLIGSIYGDDIASRERVIGWLEGTLYGAIDTLRLHAEEEEQLDEEMERIERELRERSES